MGRSSGQPLAPRWAGLLLASVALIGSTRVISERPLISPVVAALVSANQNHDYNRHQNHNNNNDNDNNNNNNNNNLQTIHYDAQTGFDLYSALDSRLRGPNHHPTGPQTVSGLANLRSMIQQQASTKERAPSHHQEPLIGSQPEAGAQLMAGNQQQARLRAPKQVASFVSHRQVGRELGPTGQPDGAQTVCLTPGCVKAAAEILKNIDERVEPCDDFYRYACGNWIDTQVIPEDKTSVSLFSVVQDELDGKLRALIERPAASGEPPIIGRMRNLYESCMNTSLNDSAVAAYYNLMVESATILGAERRDAEQQMLEVLQFETLLANFSLPREERRNISSLYNKMKLSKLSSIAPNIDWNKYLSSLLDDPLGADEEIIVNVPAFFARLDKLLVEVDSKTLANYMMWRVVLQSISTLGKRWRELAQTYNAVITGQEREEPRWEQCLGSLTGTLGIAISSMYVKNYFKSDSKGQAMEMVGYIRREFMNILDEVDWMDEETKREARAKAEAISTYIGYPDELLNDGLIEDLYAGLELRRGEYFDNILNLRKWSTDYSFRQLRKPNLKLDWRKHARAATVNAFYNSLDNSIEFPAGILQGAFFDKAKPNYLNFGAIGFVIGHEITHGFDDRGRQFDKDGNNRNWWNSETDLRFKERAQCIVDQYSNYTVPENQLKVNGINTQGENIADNGGLKEAFRAYEQWVRLNGQEAMLPGISLNQKQLFWVSAANVWCGKYRPEVLKMRVLVGSHSPAQFRITGPLSNLKEFSETFNCPVGAPLNPVKKCSVW